MNFYCEQFDLFITLLITRQLTGGLHYDFEAFAYDSFIQIMQLSAEEVEQTYGTRQIGRDQARTLVRLMDFFCFSEVRSYCLSVFVFFFFFFYNNIYPLLPTLHIFQTTKLQRKKNLIKYMLLQIGWKPVYINILIDIACLVCGIASILGLQTFWGIFYIFCWKGIELSFSK